MAENAITTLTADHRTVDGLFKKFEATTERAHKTRKELVEKFSRELSIHAAVEEQVFYPRLREIGKELKDEVLESLEEHHVVKVLLAELAGMEPADERYGAKVQVLMENVRHHVKEEESDLFPRARKALKPEELRQLGERIEAARTMAPTRPHPNAPDDQPGNLGNVLVAGVDAARDAAGAAVSATGQIAHKAHRAATSNR